MPNGSVCYCTVIRRLQLAASFRASSFVSSAFVLLTPFGFIPLSIVCALYNINIGTVAGEKKHRLKCDRRKPYTRSTPEKFFNSNSMLNSQADFCRFDFYLNNFH